MIELNYHVKLMESLSKGVQVGALAANLIAPSVTVLILYELVPNICLFIWYICNIIIYLFRFKNSKNLQKYISIKNTKLIRASFKFLLFLTALSALAYASIIWISVYYHLNTTELLIISIILITLTAGSLGTLGSIFLVFFTYISFSIIPLIGAMLYHGGDLFNILSAVLIIFFIVHTISARRLYLNQRDSISLKDSFTTIFNQTSDGIALIQNHKFIDSNKSIINMFGFDSKESFLNANTSMLSPQYQPDGNESIKKMYEVVNTAWEKGNYGYQWLHTKVDGELFWTDINLTRITLNGEDIIYGIWRDISDRKKAEAQLEKLNNTLEKKVSQQILEMTKKTALFETIFNTAKDGIAILDLQSHFLLVNDAYEKMTGYTKNELYTTSSLALTLKHNQKEFKEIIEIVKKKGFFENFEKTYLANNNKIIDIKMNLVLMPDNKSILVVAKDITLKKLYIKKQEEQEARLLQHSKLAQMGEMISMIAHQWRQPLGAISSTVVNLKLKLELDIFDLTTQDGIANARTYFQEKLEDIETFVANLTATIDDFRHFYKPNKVPNRININIPVQKALKIIENSLITDNIHLIKEYKSTKTINLFENEVIQVLLNILKNAQDNFKIQRTTHKTISIKTNDTEKGIILEIQDNGGGIEELIYDKIFNPYFSTKLEKNGTGLGLYMSKMIIEEHHNGLLSAKNIDDGVRFTIEIPEYDIKGNNEKD